MKTLTGIIDQDAIPQEITAPFSTRLSNEAIQSRFRAGGKLRLNNTVLELKGGSHNDNTYTFLALSELEMINSKIVTNGNTLVVFCNSFLSKNSSIISFDEQNTKADDGTNAIERGHHGGNASPGDNGGNVAVHIFKKFDGLLDVNLLGQDGGEGGEGATGTQGLQGTTGRASETRTSYDGIEPPFNLIFYCHRRAGNGGVGGNGGPGGNGGNGGDAGNGGLFQLYNVGSEPISNDFIKFEGNAGKAGKKGTGGDGGNGGSGGAGGAGGRVRGGCSAGKKGANGKKGMKGSDGINGTTGINGSEIREALSLDDLIDKIK